jgi:hypothetical protein
MAARPFLTVAIRGQKDAVRIRHRARQIASLLHFPVHEQTCVAAATFVIACQALRLPGRYAIHFTIDNNQLHVDACMIGEESESGTPINRLSALMGCTTAAPLHLVKALPSDRPLADADLAWLVDSTKGVAGGLFEEIVRQNQEVLSLLHELQGQLQQPAVDAPAPPHAA